MKLAGNFRCYLEPKLEMKVGQITQLCVGFY